MKTYKEFMLNEDVSKIIIDLNKGREGKTVIGVNGNEIKNSVYLGHGYSAVKEGATIVVSPAKETALQKAVYISVEHFNLMKKAF